MEVASSGLNLVVVGRHVEVSGGKCLKVFGLFLFSFLGDDFQRMINKNLIS
jgi:hypothetical protein